jgi:hypothetical protein
VSADGAGPDSVTVPVEFVTPPKRNEGERLSDCTDGGRIESEAGAATPRYVAVTVATTELLTGFVVTVKLADVAPAAIVRLLGTVAATLLLWSDTTAPPLGAIPFSVTVPVTLLPPAVLCGFRVIAVRAGGFTRIAAVTVALAVAEIVAVLTEETPFEVTLNVAMVPPGGTVTEEGTLATETLLLDRDTGIPASGAGVFRVMVAMEVAPPMTELGFNEILCTCGGATVRLASALAALEEMVIVPFVTESTV